jgi:hypothetical protein
MTTGIKWPPNISLDSLRRYDARLVENHADWQVLRELDRRGDVDGYITNDARMLNLATEMVTLSLSRLILVATDGVGDDPLAATGLLMVHLVEITVRERENRRAQLYRLRPRELGRQREDVRKILIDLAARQYAHIDQMISRERQTIEAWPGLPLS